MTGADIVVLGGINMDLVARTARFPRPGETMEASSIETTPGGKGANQAIAASRAIGEPGRVAMVGRVGDDIFGGQLRDYLQEAGVETNGVTTTPGLASGLAIIAVDGRGENTVTAAYGANASVGEVEVSAVLERLPAARFLLVQQETPLGPTFAAITAAREAGLTVILDPAPARDVPDDFLGAASIVTPNQTEAEALSGMEVTDIATAKLAAMAIRERFSVETVIVTLGELGSFVLGPEEEFACPAYQVEAVASVGAGDSFNGALAAALVEGRTFEDAVRFASAAAAICVTREGAGASMPERAAILTMLAGR